MRAKEFITEISQSKITKRQDQSTAGLHTFSDAEHWNSDYVAYRLGMAAACTDGKTDPDMSAKSWIGKSKSTHPYSQADAEILKKAYKAVGATYKDLNNGDIHSKELDTTNKISPVASKKRNRYGV
jgi:hypothetical protein